MWINTKNFAFEVTKEWADAYFEKYLKNFILSFTTREPVYSSMEEWAEDYGYEKGVLVYEAAKKDNAVVKCQLY